MVDFPRPLASPVDRRYLRGKHEPHLAGAAARRGAPQPRFGVLAEPEQPRLCGHQGLAQFLGPPRMRKVARADDRDPLAKRPPGEMLEVAVPAAGAGEPGVDVQVGVEHAVAVRSLVIAGLPGRSDPATRVRHRDAVAAGARMIRSESSAARARAACLVCGAVGQNVYRAAARQAGGGPPLRAGHPKAVTAGALSGVRRRRAPGGPGRTGPASQSACAGARGAGRTPGRARPPAGPGRGQATAASATETAKIARTEGGGAGAEGPGRADRAASRTP